MENGKPKDQDKDMDELNLQIAQLQAMAVELKGGLMGAMQDLSVLKQRGSSLEERMRGYQKDTEEKILGIKNSLNTFKEDLSATLSQIKEVNSKHTEMQRGLELYQAEVGRQLLSCQRRKSSKEDVFPDSQRSFSSETEHNVIQHYFASLTNSSPQQSAASIQNKRQTAALELLESERVYVSYLSLLLKANITFNGSEAIHHKDKRPFPSSLRFLIQQHLELLHTLQERVLRRQWQGIMGDVFMRLTSKESDFLDYYVAYLKELPECLSVVNMYSATSLEAAGLFEGDVIGDENGPPLHTLLLQPVQRIPEYLLLLQNLLKQTDTEHPDYFLLLICIQQFRAFTGQYSHLLQHNEDLLLQNRRELRRQHTNQVKRSKQRLLEQMRCERLQDWEAESRRCDSADGPQRAFFPADADPRRVSPALQSIPEKEREASAERSSCKRPPPGTALADARGEFLLPAEAPDSEGLYEDGDSLRNVLLFENCSTASSDSSIDIAFVRCPKSHGREPFGGGQGRFPGRGCVSPDEIGLTRHRPLQAVQRKSKSLNGLQLDSPLNNDNGPVDFEMNSKGPHRGQHARLERQSSRGSAGHKAQRSISPPQKLDADGRTATEELQRDHHKVASPSPSLSSQATIAKLQLTNPVDCGGQSWMDDSRWRRGSEENGQAFFSERSRKQDQKGGFRSSFKKLFKKKSGGESKDKINEKTESQAYTDHEPIKTPQVARLADVDRGTAV
ncbi:rho guanine nucleotide exchange factor 33-like [Megalops cyprinoides]|uniref:rho guanine nucleotide exchange factor 33-like n=1 Tax=Megalops cyprinoides TaxID=118141 RepID=UPI001864DE21|nr:rho guanine nucleotide exchange factor 33-like [Megalops cyprinoides]